MSKLKGEYKFRIMKLVNVSDSLYKEIKEVAYDIDDADAVHIAFSIHHKCQHFITIDEKLLNNSNLVSYLRKKYELIIKDPY